MSSISALSSERYSTARAETNWLESTRRTATYALGLVSAALGSVWGLLACKCIILAVSAMDIYLTVKYVEFMPQLELNPIGRWLLCVDQGPECKLQQAAAFITAKFAGNVLVLAIIEMLAHCRFRRVGFVAAAVALFQILLGIFLLYADLSDTP
ncbi:MAG: hypothetical protein SFV81_12470 [Pirellulaceae bacterium]|nr:hypothetical protein [Pirellulaceae bacterium]